MMKPKKLVTVEDWGYWSAPDKRTFSVVKTQNTIDPHVGEKLGPTAVQALIDAGIQVTVIPKR